MLFNKNTQELTDLKAIFTVSEIKQQPCTWLKTLRIVEENRSVIEEFINNVITKEHFHIVFTGAGTSEFVGNSLTDLLRNRYGQRIESIASTAIVTNPSLYFEREVPTLLISFGRSGNSPESLGAIYGAEACCDKLYCLNITCNAKGELALYQGNHGSKQLALNLPPETHDQSFAMTSSYTNMYLAAYLSLTLDKLEQNAKELELVAAEGENFLKNQIQTIDDMIQKFNFDRIVYLGSNNLKGVAQESGLKMLELTTGEVASLFDTCLGFRHGPKSFISDKTLVVIYTSNEETPLKYEQDLFNELMNNRVAKVMVVTTTQQAETYKNADALVVYDQHISQQWLVLLDILVAQSISVEKSVALNHTPDNPFPSGMVNRVVQGVVIYPYEGKR